MYTPNVTICLMCTLFNACIHAYIHMYMHTYVCANIILLQLEKQKKHLAAYHGHGEQTVDSDAEVRVYMYLHMTYM